MRKLAIGIILMLFAVALCAQKGKMKKAQRFFDAFQYQHAIEIYSDILKKSDLREAKVKIAEAYRKINDYKNAAYWYKQVVNLPEALPEHKFQLGLMLQQTDNCDQAKIWFSAYLKMRPYDHRKLMLQNPCKYYNALLEKGADKVAIQSFPFNTPFSDIGPAFFGEDLVFASRQDPFMDLLGFYILRQGGQSDTSPLEGNSPPEVFSEKLNSELNEAILTFSRDQKEVFFTRNRNRNPQSFDEGLIHLEIVFSKWEENGNWSDLIPLSINSAIYSVAHPSLSADGLLLFFSSDMPGGFGGKDIYITYREKEGWGPPVNLGPLVNTDGDELYPFFTPERRLYFSSDGHYGLGGQDIFFSDDQGNGDWSQPENLGAPINSSFDDFSFIIRNASQGYFCSNRPGGAGADDIYSFKKESARKPVQVIVESSTMPVDLKKEVLYSISGQVTDQISGNGLSNVRIVLKSSDCLVPPPVKTTTDGTFFIKTQKDCCYQFRVEKEGYFSKTESFSICFHSAKEAQKNIDFFLQPIFVDEEGLDSLIDKQISNRMFDISDRQENEKGAISYQLNIYYDLGRTSVKKESFVELEKLVKLLEDNPSLVVEISSHTDSQGKSSFNQDLSQNRADKVVEWLIGNGIKRDRLIAKGYGETRLVNDCGDGVECTEEQHQMNRRTEFKVVGVGKD